MLQSQFKMHLVLCLIAELNYIEAKPGRIYFNRNDNGYDFDIPEFIGKSSSSSSSNSLPSTPSPSSRPQSSAAEPGRQDFVHERGNLLEGDILQQEQSAGGGANVRRWNNGQIPFVIDRSISSSERNVISEAISEIGRRTCIRLTPRSSEKDFVRFMKAGSGCSSFIGRIGADQVISLDHGCYTKQTVVHEIIHAIGFFHEQSRRDRDEFVNIHRGNIPDNQQHNFNKRPDTDDFGVPYDFASIMHYSAYAFAANQNMPTITSKTGFPTRDFGRGDGRGGMTDSDALQINRMYGCTTRS